MSSLSSTLHVLNLLCMCIFVKHADSVELNIVRNIEVGGKIIYAYKNIPYAEPLNSSLRFEAPVPLQEVRPQVNPDKEVICPQIYNRRSDLGKGRKYGDIIGEEDCLLLDIYSKKEADNSLSLPVLVYFHGGEFMYGSKNDYCPSYLMRDNDMIVVIPNYRLGAFGFLSIDGSDTSGNMGILDQQLALAWVYENINKFGGDKSRIAIGGHDAGGAAVSLHIILPNSQKYIVAAISGSGTIMDPWALSKKNQTKTQQFANHLSCSRSFWKDMLNCLKSKSMENIVTAQKESRVTFGPVVDGVLISDTPQTLFSNKKWTIPLLAGVTRDEASLKFYSEFDIASKDINLDKILEYYLYPYFSETKYKEFIVKAAKYEYLRGITGETFEPFEAPIINLLSDFLYNSGLERLLKSYEVVGNKSWMYVFAYENAKESIGNAFRLPREKENYGVGHMDDVMYLFNTTFVETVYNNTGKMEDKIINQQTYIWNTFIQTGELPSRGYEKWNTTDKCYVEILYAKEPILKNYRSKEMDFWNDFVASIQSANNTNENEDPSVTKAGAPSNVYGLTALVIILAILCVALAGVMIIMRRRYSRKYATTSTSQGHGGKDSSV